MAAAIEADCIGAARQLWADGASDEKVTNHLLVYLRDDVTPRAVRVALAERLTEAAKATD